MTASATEQEADLLIIGNDTVYLKTFILEKLDLKFSPFGNTRETAPSTACWRGYKAIWRITDNKLYLEKILRCHSDPKVGEENIFELFQKNGLKVETKDDMILADWCSLDFYKMTFSIAKFYKDKLYLYDGWNNKKKESDVILRIEKGSVTKNTIEVLKTTANMGFAASVAGRWQHQQQFAIWLQSGLDEMLLGFWFLTCTFKSLISSGSRQTEC